MDTSTRQSPANPIPLSTPPRCAHLYANGRCRLPVFGPDSQFCFRHARLPEHQREPEDFSAALTAGLGELTSAAAINDFLSRLLLLLAQNRIPARRAAVLAYITSLLLRSLPAIADETKRDQPPEPIIWDLPRPPHEEMDAESRAAAFVRR